MVSLYYNNIRIRIIYIYFIPNVKICIENLIIRICLLTDAKLVIFMLTDVKYRVKIWWFKIKALTLQQKSENNKFNNLKV